MIFDEIIPRTKIIITATNGTDMQARFMSKVIKNNGEFLLIIPFKHKGMRVGFAGKQIKLHMEVRDDNGVLWNFRNCKITTVKKDGLIYHKLISPMKNGIENRRGGRRFYIWDQCSVDIEGVSNLLFTNCRDIGLTGCSFVVDHKKGLELKEGTKVSISLKNKDGLEMNLVGMIVRKEKMDRYTVYGVKLDNPPIEYISYVKFLEKRTTVAEAEF